MPDPANVLANPGFESGTASWNSYFAGGVASFSTGTPAFECERSAILSFSGSSSNMQLYQTGFSLQPNTAYVLSFAGSANSGHNLQVYLQKHTSPYTSYGLSATADLTSSWKVFTFPFTTGSDTSVPRLRFWFVGSAVAGDVYMLDDIRILPAGGSTTPATSTPVPTVTSTPVPTTATNTPVPTTATSTPVPTTATNTPVPAATNTPAPEATGTPQATPTLPGDDSCSVTGANVLRNPSFEDAARNWTFYSSALGGISTPGGDVYECAAAARLSFVTIGNNMQLYQNGFTLEAGRRYRLSFAAYSTDGRDLQVRVQRHSSPYTSYGLNRSADLSDGWREYVYEFQTVGFSGTTTDTRLYFWFVGNAAAGDVYMIDRVRLEAQ